jgi:hypothetical protein
MYIYKIINKITGRWYIGKHKGSNPKYMGSGKLIIRAIKKHGIDNFKKEILYIFDTEAEMNAKEKDLVVINESTYNLCAGGQGGFSYINRSGKNIYPNHGKLSAKNAADTVRNLRQTDEAYNAQFMQNMHKRRQKSIEVIKSKYPDGIWKGKHHTEETKNKIASHTSVHQKGEGNSQYGTCWVTNGTENKKISKLELDNYLKLGYNKGRVMPG